MKKDECMQREITELRKEVDALRQQRLERTPKTDPESDPAPTASEESIPGEAEKSAADLDWSDFEKVFDDLVSATHEEIEEHPVGAISIAFLLGFIVGRGT
jgi:hypothetical protein